MRIGGGGQRALQRVIDGLVVGGLVGLDGDEQQTGARGERRDGRDPTGGVGAGLEPLVAAPVEDGWAA